MRMNNIFEIAAIACILLGIMLATVGPGGKDIAKEMDRAKGTPFSNAVMDREAPSKLKLLFFKIIITFGFVLLWPIFTYSLMRERNSIIADEKRLEEKYKKLWFHYMGGHGAIRCQDCDHSEEVTSFIHGVNSSIAGFQCQSCGKISSIEAGGPGRVNEYEESLVCQCGGVLERDKAIFCPNCKSEKLSYQMQYIT